MTAPTINGPAKTGRPAIPGQRTDSDALETTSGDRPEEIAPEISAEDLDAQSPAADLVRVYLNGIGKTALLPAAQEVELAKRIEAGVFAQHVLDEAEPGVEGWTEVGAAVARLDGPRWRHEVDGPAAALLAGCQGRLALGELVELLAFAHDRTADELVAAALPAVREFVRHGVLVPA